ncbi:MAG: hypothetical protein K0R38_5107 [Polyangiaceae bacterium]|jgi:hypothetical protein|nr:hypothetical protein [Polyangiaceae bacterium]
MSLESLDLAIGLIVVFLLVSTICSAVREGLEAILKTRAAYLEHAIRELLDDRDGKGLAKSLFEHPFVSGLLVGRYVPKPLRKKAWVLANGRGLPSYVPASSVAKVLLDIAGRGTTTDEVSSDPSSVPLSVASIRARLLNIGSVRVRRVLLHALDTSRGDLELAQKNLEDWFNDSMDRVSGWYKRSTQWIVFVIAIAVAVGMNIDSIGIAKHLYRDEAARKAAVATAYEITDPQRPPTQEEATKVLHALELPIGWNADTTPRSGNDWLNRALGWLLTAFAATLGAPFWFDVLNKVMVIRSTVKPREKSPDEFSEDRQAPTVAVAAAPAPAAASDGRPAAPSVILAPSVVLAPREPENEHYCCGREPSEPTADEELPAARGGVAL